MVVVRSLHGVKQSEARSVEHTGPHGIYNAFVYKRLSRAVKTLKAGTVEYQERFIRELIRLRREVVDPTTPLGRLLQERATGFESLVTRPR